MYNMNAHEKQIWILGVHMSQNTHQLDVRISDLRCLTDVKQLAAWPVIDGGWLPCGCTCRFLKNTCGIYD